MNKGNKFQTKNNKKPPKTKQQQKPPKDQIRKGLLKHGDKTQQERKEKLFK